MALPSLPPINNNIREDIKEYGKGLYALLHANVSLFRHATDWAKPTLDSVIDAGSVALAANAGVGLLVWSGLQGFERALGPEHYATLERVLNNHEYTHLALETLAYTAIYGYANTKVIMPSVKKVFNRTTTPSALNWVKTLGIATGFTLLSFEGAFDIVGSKFHTLESILSGYREAEVTRNTIVTVNDFLIKGEFAIENPAKSLEQLMEQFSYPTDNPTATSLEQAFDRAGHRNTNFAYTDSISQSAAAINARGISITPEELIYMSRLLYGEAGFDRIAQTEEDVRRGLRAVAFVIYNRWQHDQHNYELYERRDFSNGPTVFDTAFMHTQRKNTTVWQFTCVRDHPEYFYTYLGTRHADMYEGGILHPGITLNGRAMDQRRAQMAAEELIDVLMGRVTDPTQGALFYQNPTGVDRYNTPAIWRKRGLRETITINSHVFYTYQRGRDGNQATLFPRKNDEYLADRGKNEYLLNQPRFKQQYRA